MCPASSFPLAQWVPGPALGAPRAPGRPCSQGRGPWKRGLSSPSRAPCGPRGAPAELCPVPPGLLQDLTGLRGAAACPAATRAADARTRSAETCPGRQEGEQGAEEGDSQPQPGRGGVAQTLVVPRRRHSVCVTMEPSVFWKGRLCAVRCVCLCLCPRVNHQLRAGAAAHPEACRSRACPPARRVVSALTTGQVGPLLSLTSSWRAPRFCRACSQ